VSSPYLTVVLGKFNLMKEEICEFNLSDMETFLF